MLLVWRWAMVWSALCGCLLSPALYLEPHLAIVYFLRFEYVRTWAVCQGRWESRAAPPCPWWRLWEPLDNRPHIPVETGPIQMVKPLSVTREVWVCVYDARAICCFRILSCLQSECFDTRYVFYRGGMVCNSASMESD